MTSGRTMPSHFNPRSSCEERPLDERTVGCLMYFNPRSSCEERLCPSPSTTATYNFNPRSSCEERLDAFHALDGLG